MSTFQELSGDFKKLNASLQQNVRNILSEESKTILKDLQDRSPVDTGFFRSNWKVTLSRFSPGSTISGISIRNDTPYAFWMEYGAPKFSAPWYYPLRDKRTGRFRKGTGKLKESQGRIWAGGLNPGHSMTIGGAIGPSVERALNRMEQRFGKSFTDAFK